MRYEPLAPAELLTIVSSNDGWRYFIRTCIDDAPEAHSWAELGTVWSTEMFTWEQICSFGVVSVELDTQKVLEKIKTCKQH